MTGADQSAMPNTPDGRYFVVRDRLWRRSNPNLDPQTRDHLVSELMSARRAVRAAKGDTEATAAARRRVNGAKVALGERGPVWWDDGAPDLNRRMVANTSYAPWFAGLASGNDTQADIPADLQTPAPPLT